MHVRMLSPVFAAAGAVTIAWGCESFVPPEATSREVTPLVAAHRDVLSRGTPAGWLGAPEGGAARAESNAEEPLLDATVAALTHARALARGQAVAEARAALRGAAERLHDGAYDLPDGLRGAVLVLANDLLLVARRGAAAPEDLDYAIDGVRDEAQRLAARAAAAAQEGGVAAAEPAPGSERMR